MRVFSMPPSPYPVHSTPHPTVNPGASPNSLFCNFSTDAFASARTRGVPIFLLISDHPESVLDPSLAMHLNERTVPVHLRPGERPDVELLCQRASVLFSGEGVLPLCALLTADALPFLAAPLPPAGFMLDPARLYTWLSQADRRFVQNMPACASQATQVIRSFRSAPINKPYSPQDAAHDLSFRFLDVVDKVSVCICTDLLVSEHQSCVQ